MAALTNYHRLSGSKQHKCINLQFCRLKVQRRSLWAKTKVLAGMWFFRRLWGIKIICLLTVSSFLRLLAFLGLWSPLSPSSVPDASCMWAWATAAEFWSLSPLNVLRFHLPLPGQTSYCLSIHFLSACFTVWGNGYVLVPLMKSFLLPLVLFVGFRWHLRRRLLHHLWNIHSSN